MMPPEMKDAIDAMIHAAFKMKFLYRGVSESMHNSLADLDRCALDLRRQRDLYEIRILETLCTAERQKRAANPDGEVTA